MEDLFERLHPERSEVELADILLVEDLRRAEQLWISLRALRQHDIPVVLVERFVSTRNVCSDETGSMTSTS